MTEHDLNTVRHLTEKFFNATISEAEMSLLDKYAESILSGKENGVMPDRMLLNDLSVVAALHQLNLRTLDNLSAQTPPGLEARLEKHISRISASSRTEMATRRHIFGRGSCNSGDNSHNRSSIPATLIS